MKRLISCITVTAMLALLLISPVCAAERSASRVYPSLTFSGTTANCSVTVIADSAEETISITVKLWDGSTCIKTWNDTGTGTLVFKGTATVEKGKTYDMTVDVTIDEEEYATQTVSGVCK